MRAIKTLLLAVAALLVVAPLASAQDVSSATLEWRVDPPQSDPTQGIERNATDAFIIVYVKYCYTGPGLNPNGGTVTAEVAPGEPKPEWLEVQGGATFEWTPDQATPPGEPICDEQSTTFAVTPGGTAPYGAVEDVGIKLTVTESDDMGTYKKVAMEETKTIKVGVKTPDNAFPGSGEDGGDGGDGDDGGETTEESPAAAPLIILLTLVGLVALRRRR